MLNDPIVIVGAARTPMGALLGDFASLSASELGAFAMQFLEPELHPVWKKQLLQGLADRHFAARVAPDVQKRVSGSAR